MNILSITYFVTVAEKLSFTSAARDLYISQPSISKKIAELEEELGLLLFQRSGKTIQLTAAGQQLYYDFKTLLQFLNEITLHAKDINNSVTGVIRVGIPQGMDISRIIPEFFNSFITSNPGIRVSCSFETGNNLVASFLNGSLDCTFFLSFIADSLQSELSIERLDMPKGPHRLLYSPSLFPDIAQPAIDAFKNKTFMFYRTVNNGDVISGNAHIVLEEVGLKPKNTMWVESLDELLLYVMEGLCVTVVGPSYRVDESQRLRWLPLMSESSMVGLCLCWKTVNTNAALHSFINTVTKWVKADKT